MTTSDANASRKKKSLRTLIPIFQFVSPYKGMFVAALVALLFTAAVSLSLGQGVRIVIDSGFVAASKEQLTHSMLIMVVMIALLAIGTFCRFYLMSWLGERVSADIRRSVFDRLVSLHPSFFEENRSGELMSRLTTDTSLLQSIVGSSFSMALRSTITLVGGLIMLVITNWKLSLAVLLFVPMVILPMFLFGRRVRSLSQQSQDRIADIGTYAGEIIQNIKVVQSYTRESHESVAFGNEVERAFAVAKRRIRQRAFLITVVTFLAFCGICAMLWSGGMDVLSGEISGGELGAFVFYALMVALSVATISEVYGELQRAAGAADRLVDLLAVESEITSIKNPDTPKSNIRNILKFENVSFCYPSRPNDPALKNISFEVGAGRIIALVGPSGAGKTTVFELLQRFYDPQSGAIKFMDVDVPMLDLSELRKKMGMVPQQPVLFSTDVWKNIRYGNLDASDEDVIDAAKRAHAHEFIAALPEQYDSYLGEQGVRLSGGQKQRIALARAILKDPQILLLDEATSALDAESEFHVQAALNELMKDRTTLIIAHRLSTVMHADEILVMEKGELVAKGTHEALLKTSPLYQRLCELQFDV